MVRIVSCVLAVLLCVEACPAVAPLVPSSRDRYGDPLPPGAVLRLGTVRFQHSLWGCARLQFTTDGKTLVSSTSYGVKIWDIATGRESAFPVSDRIEAATLTADGKTLVLVVLVVTRGKDFISEMRSRSLQHWDFRKRALLRQAALPADRDRDFAISPDGRAVAAYDYNKGSVVWSDAGRKLADFTADSYVPPHVFSGFQQPPLAFSPDGKRLAVAGANAVLAVCDLVGKTKLHRFRSEDARRGFTAPCFSPDGSLLAACGETSLHLWDVKTGKLLHRREVSGGSVPTWHPGPHGRTYLSEQEIPLAFSPDGKRIAYADHLAIHLLDTRDLKPVRTFAPHHQGAVTVLAFSPDGKRLTLGGGRITFWDVAGGRKLTDPDGHHAEVNSLAFSADGAHLASGGSDGAACVWQLSTGRMLHRFRGHQNSVPGLAFSPDGKTLATGDGHPIWAKDGCEAQVRLFDLASGRRTLQFTAHLHSAHTLRFSPDGKKLASGGKDSRVRLWDVASGKRLWQARSFYEPVVFLDKGKSLLLCSFDYDYATFDVASGKKRGGEGSAMRQRLSGVILDWPRLQKERAWADAFSFDGKTRTEDGGWRGSKRMMALRDHGTNRPFAVIDFASVKAFSPDGRWLAASDDTTILIYDVAQLRVEFLCEELLAGRKGSRLKRNAAGVVREVGVRLRRLVADETRAAPLIRDLDADDFDTREKATAELGKMGVDARLPLLQARARSKSPEVRRRVARLLLRLDGKGGDLTLAGLERVLWALAKRGGQARGLVEELSRGPKDAAVTRAARKALGK